MTVASSFGLPDHAVLRRMDGLARDEHQRTAETLELLGTIDARRLYAAAGYPSLKAYCCERLRFSEDIAEQRIRAARVAARFSCVLERIADARLSVSTLLMLARHLTPENADELLVAASGRTRFEVQTLLAARFPRPDLPAVVHELTATGRRRRMAPCGGHEALVVLRGDVTTLEPVPERVEFAPELASASAAAPAFELTSPPSQAEVFPVRASISGRIEPLSEGRVGVQFTMPSRVHGKLRFARALLGHAVPNGDLAQVFERALDALIAALERKRFGAGARSRGGSGDAAGIPAEVRAEVYVRDGGRCTFVSEDGHRCGCDTRLEYDHIVLVAHGGEHTTANLRLRCRAHNQWEAERVLGAGFMQVKRDRARGRSVAIWAGRGAEEGSAPRAIATRADSVTDITNALRILGARREEIRHALEHTAHLAHAPLEARLLAAVRMLKPTGGRTLRPAGTAGGG